MSELFLNILNMSISASWIVLAVLLLRLLLNKTPKWITVLLWGIVGFRLVCPFSFESDLSLVPSSQTIPTNIALSPSPGIDSGVPIINDTINPIIKDNFTPVSENSVNPLQTVIYVISIIWVAGIIAMLIYTAISYLKVQKRIRTAVLLRDNIYQSETVGSPFVLGLIKPKIYLPFNISEQQIEYVICHEQSHLKRKDHLWKPIGFLILAVYWFNPLFWLAYILLCRDIELACDEKVVNELDDIQRANYSEALLNCSINRHMIAACPLSFGEVGIKQRVKNVLGYKKPAFWMIIIAFLTIIALSVCLLTNPPKSDKNAANNSSLLSTLTGTDDLNQIKRFEIIHKYGGSITEITDNNDFSCIKEYNYSHEYPKEDLYKLFIFPENQMIKVVNANNETQTIYLMNDGSMVVQTKTSFDVYTAKSNHMLNEKALIRMITKYTITQNQ